MAIFTDLELYDHDNQPTSFKLVGGNLKAHPKKHKRTREDPKDYSIESIDTFDLLAVFKGDYGYNISI